MNHGIGVKLESGLANFLHTNFFSAQDSVFERAGLLGERWGRRCGIFCGHLNIDVFEDVARGNAEDAFVRFDEVITFASAMLAAEVIGEAERGSELLGLD